MLRFDLKFTLYCFNSYATPVRFKKGVTKSFFYFLLIKHFVYTRLEIDALLNLCRQKDPRAQMEVYQRFHKAMYYSALRILRQPEDAEDVMHESFLTAFEKLHQYKGDNRFAGWLKQITLRTAIQHSEKKKRNPQAQDPTMWLEEQTEKGIDENTEEEQRQQQQMMKALSSLLPRYQQALSLMYLEGLDYEEISMLLEISNGTCRTLISRAKQQLKEKMKEHGY